MSQMHLNTLSLLLFISLQLTSSIPPSFSESLDYHYNSCKPTPYTCGSMNINLTYPFSAENIDRPEFCALPGYQLQCINDYLTIYINDSPFLVKNIDSLNRLLEVIDQTLAHQTCPLPYYNTSIDKTRFMFTESDQNVTVFVNCAGASADAPMLPDLYEIGSCLGGHSYFRLRNDTLPNMLGTCNSTLVVWLQATTAEPLATGNLSFGDAVNNGFTLQWTAGTGWCNDCVSSGGYCGYNGSSSATDETCFCPYGPVVGSCSNYTDDHATSHSSKKTGMIIGIAAAGGAVLLLLLICLLIMHKKKQKMVNSSSKLLKHISYGSDPRSGNEDTDSGSVHDLHTHVFTYEELEEATNGFDATQELGDGGFGTVYKGKLRDGRIVAVKRLYENSYKRMEQFVNEAAILSRLRHPNLVNFYGCTSRHSRELLLVYEFVPNGTVADHLHGSRAHEHALTWPVRLSIAIEVADALAYLHAIEPPIMHRDVKTTNILLDAHFHVKVADFGLSRLFPLDATHVSTLPQGTPGYVDPEYHRCYQLTDKSDVYSFGVVLVELISSKPAVDVARSRNEINLAYMAVNKIQRDELDQLVDMELGFNADPETKKMMTVVAELAFRCLQQDSEMRPPIKEVLGALRGLQKGSRVDIGEGEVDADDKGLLKSMVAPFSPTSVTTKWESKFTTPNNSQ